MTLTVSLRSLRAPRTGRGAPARGVACAAASPGRRGRTRGGAGRRARRAAPARRRPVAPPAAAWRAATVGQTTTSPSTTGGSSASAGAPGPRPPSSGSRPAVRAALVDREGEHVGGALAVEEPPVEVGDRRLVDEDEAELGVGVDAFLVQDELGEADPAGDLDVDRVLLVEAADLHRSRARHAGRAGSGRAGHALALLVGVDDVLDDPVAHDVGGAELDELARRRCRRGSRARCGARTGRGPRGGRSG